MFGSKKNQTLREQYGTPWEIRSSDGTVRRPPNDGECLEELLDCLNPTVDAPLTMRYEGTTEVVTAYDDGMRFCYTHLFDN